MVNEGECACVDADAGEGEAGSKLIEGRAVDTARIRRGPAFGRVVTSFPGGEEGGTAPGDNEIGGFLANPETFDLTRTWPPNVEPAGLEGVEASPGRGAGVFTGVWSPSEE